MKEKITSPSGAGSSREGDKFFVNRDKRKLCSRRSFDLLRQALQNPTFSE